MNYKQIILLSALISVQCFASYDYRLSHPAPMPEHIAQLQAQAVITFPSSAALPDSDLSSYGVPHTAYTNGLSMPTAPLPHYYGLPSSVALPSTGMMMPAMSHLTSHIPHNADDEYTPEKLRELGFEPEAEESDAVLPSYAPMPAPSAAPHFSAYPYVNAIPATPATPMPLSEADEFNTSEPKTQFLYDPYSQASIELHHASLPPAVEIAPQTPLIPEPILGFDEPQTPRVHYELTPATPRNDLPSLPTPATPRGDMDLPIPASPLPLDAIGYMPATPSAVKPFEAPEEDDTDISAELLVDPSLLEKIHKTKKGDSTNSSEKVICPGCQRSFDTLKGLSLHNKGCPSKEIIKDSILFPKIDWSTWPETINEETSNQAWHTIIYFDTKKANYHCLICANADKIYSKKGNGQLENVKAHILSQHMHRPDIKHFVLDKAFASKIAFARYIKNNKLIEGLDSVKKENHPDFKKILPPVPLFKPEFKPSEIRNKAGILIQLPKIDWRKWPEIINDRTIKDAWNILIYEDLNGLFHCLLCTENEIGSKKKGTTNKSALQCHILGNHVSSTDKKLLCDDNSLTHNQLIGRYIKKNHLLEGLKSIKKENHPDFKKAPLPPVPLFSSLPSEPPISNAISEPAASAESLLPPPPVIEDEKEFIESIFEPESTKIPDLIPIAEYKPTDDLSTFLHQTPALYPTKRKSTDKAEADEANKRILLTKSFMRSQADATETAGPWDTLFAKNICLWPDCDYVNKRTTPYEMKRHLLKHVSKFVLKNLELQCSDCNYYQDGQLKLHLLKEHPDYLLKVLLDEQAKLK